MDGVGNVLTGTVYYGTANGTGNTGFPQTHRYDAANRLITVQDYANQTLATYRYDSLSRTNGISWVNGATTSYGYDANDDLNSLTQTGGGTTLSWGLSHNGAHQITEYDVNSSSMEMTSSVSGPGGTNFTTDSLNRYTAVQNTTPTYDKNGNLTYDGTFTYQYDEENRLRSAVSSSTTATYDYDPAGRRRSKTVNGTTTYYSSDGPNEVAEWAGAGSSVATGSFLRGYYYGAGSDDLLVSEAPTGDANQLLVYHTDPHGSPVLLSNSINATYDSYQYGPYGETTNGSTGNVFRYTGRRLDPETGLYYYRARYYSTALGRFLQTDPIGSKDDLNLYAYTGGDPVNGIDPTGTDDVPSAPTASSSTNYATCSNVGICDSGSLAATDLSVRNGVANGVYENVAGLENLTSSIIKIPLAPGIDKDAMAKFMDDHVAKSSQGKCAAYCRRGLEAGGLDTTGHPVDAKDYGEFLTNHGASIVPHDKTYTPQKGDIVVFGGNDSHPYGHIEMYDGSNWISDFKQNNFSPYRGDVPPDTIYRFP